MIAQRFVFLFGILLFSSAANAETQPVKAKAESVKINRVDISDTVTLSGYPDIQMASEIYAANALVIDLRLPEEQVDPTPNLADIGLEVHNLPIGKSPLKQQTLDQLNTLLRSHPSRKIWLHCSSGNRAGLLWAAKLINDGMTVERATKQVKLVATRQATLDAINIYAKSIESPSGNAPAEPH